MTTPPEGRKASPRILASYRRWLERDEDIVAGKIVPGYKDRRSGHSPFQGSSLLDLRQQIDVELERDMLPEGVADALRHCYAVPTASAIWEASRSVPDDLHGDHYGDLRASLVWHAAFRAHPQAASELLATTVKRQGRQEVVGWAMSMMLATGLALAGKNEDLTDELESEDAEEAREKGLDRIDRLREVFDELQLCMESMRAGDDGDTEEAAQSGMASALASMKAAQEQRKQQTEIDEQEFIQRVLEDRGEISRKPERLVVDANPAEKQSGARADIWKAYKSVIGAPLPLVSTAAVPAARDALHTRYPHMHVEIDAILATQSALQSIKLAVLLVGEPGSGKTTFARELAERLGVPAMTYSCAGASDGAFGGTSAQWNSARPATPMQLIGRSKVANPAMVLDEVDKIGTSRHNGSLADTLLTFLEPTSSRVFYDLALEVPVDLSAVSYIATANELSDVPAPLQDRFKIVRIPSPGFEHIGALSERIIDDLARERGLDRRWIEPLAQDEEDLVRRSWQGGSLRQLTRIVTMLVDGREQLMGRA